MSSFDVCFHTKVGKSSHVNFYRLYKTRIGGLSYSSTKDSLFDFYTNKTEQHLSTDINFIVTYSGLDETSRVAYYLGETQTCNSVLLFF